ncbi:hypothetical protein ACFE04_012314 [Oxalis oulophora]
MSSMRIFALMMFLLIIISFLPNLATSDDVAGDTISATQTLKDGDTLVSANGTFELGLFSPGSSRLKYLAIRYNQILEKTIAWVANRQVGINNSSGVLRLSEDGILILSGEEGTPVWSSNRTRTARDPVAQLLDSGNLVVKDRNDNNSENYLWQSFDYPGDTGLTGVKLGINKKTGLDRSLSSWKTSDDPSRGNYTYGFDITGLPQIVLRRNSIIQYRTGPWNGLQFSGSPYSRATSLDNITYVSNEDEVYLLSKVYNSSTLTRLYINPQGVRQWYIWTGTWFSNVAGQLDACDYYSTCGSYGMCDYNNSVICSCLSGFEPRNRQEWETGTWKGGCVRKTELNCSSDGFKEVSGVKVPDTKYYWSNSSINLVECRRLCLNKCNCTAYGSLDVREGGSGCLQWFGDLTDMKSFPSSEQNIYVRLAASDIAASDDGRKSNSSKTVGIAVGVSLSLVVLILGLVVGYMSPEYAIDGLYSIKSDVFSYGVLVLEIVNGKRNRGFSHPDHHHNLLGHAWRLFHEDNTWDLMDETFKETCNVTEVLRSIHIGLLCVQRDPDDRPSMSSVVMMLGSEGQLPEPKQPGFYTERDVGGGGVYCSTSSEKASHLVNDYTITVIEPR